MKWKRKKIVKRKKFVKINGVRKEVVDIDMSNLKTGMGILVGNILVFSEGRRNFHVHVIDDENMEEGIKKVREQYQLEEIVEK